MPFDSNLRALYWQKRACRTDACRRRWWRRIAVEKKRLLAAGVPAIELHLWCRHLTNLRNPNAAARLDNFYAQGVLFAWTAKP